MLWLLTRTVSDSSLQHQEQMFKLTDMNILVTDTRVCNSIYMASYSDLYLGNTN